LWEILRSQNTRRLSTQINFSVKRNVIKNMNGKKQKDFQEMCQNIFNTVFIVLVLCGIATGKIDLKTTRL
jgi:hypothetical protein